MISGPLPASGAGRPPRTWPRTIPPRGPGLFEVVRADGERAITNVRRLAGFDRTPGSRVIAFATWLLVLLGAGLMYVSFQAQYTYIYAVKHVSVASAIEAAMLDAGMIILSALGIGLALAGKPSKAERFLIMVCAGLSAFMNYAAADTASWRSVVAYVAAPVFLAVIVDRVISVIRRHVLPMDAESAWVPLGRGLRAAGWPAPGWSCCTCCGSPWRRRRRLRGSAGGSWWPRRCRSRRPGRRYR